MIRMTDGRAAIIESLTLVDDVVTAAIAFYRHGPAARDQSDNPLLRQTPTLPLPPEYIAALRADLIKALTDAASGDEPALPTFTDATALPDNTGLLLPNGHVAVIDRAMIRNRALVVILVIWIDGESIGQGWPEDQQTHAVPRSDDWLARTMSDAERFTAAVIGGQVV